MDQHHCRLTIAIHTCIGVIALEVCHALVTIATQIPGVLEDQKMEIKQRFCTAISQRSLPVGVVEDVVSNNIAVSEYGIVLQVIANCSSKE